MPSVRTCPANDVPFSLRGARQHLNLSQVALAMRLGVTQPHVAQLEAQADMHLSTLQRYVAALWRIGGRLMPPRRPALRALLLLFALGALLGRPVMAGQTVRVAVVGGIAMSGVWPALVPLAEKATGLRIETVAAAPKEGVVPAFRQGEADLLLIHGSDETYALQAAGLAAPLRAWAMNEHVIVGPSDDPAQIAGSRDGTEALERIIKANAPMIGFRDPGSFSIVAGLLRAAGLRLGPRQQLFDEGPAPQAVLRSAAANQAYVVVGHIPVAFGKMPSEGMRVLVKGDPAMRRVYVAVEPGPRHPATRQQRRAAHKLAEYLLSPAGQAALRQADATAGGPWIFPLQGDKPRH